MLTFKAGLGKDRLPDLTVTPLDIESGNCDVTR